jgi:hypothetical protein
MLLFTTDYPDYVNMPCFPCKAALLNLAFPWLGPCMSAKRPFDRAMLMARLLPLPLSPYLQGSLVELCSPTLCWSLAFSAQRLWHGLAYVSFFSIYLVTGLPHVSDENSTNTLLIVSFYVLWLFFCLTKMFSWFVFKKPLHNAPMSLYFLKLLKFLNLGLVCF